MAICSSFYQYLLLEEYTYTNPVALIRQKSKFVQKRQGHTRVRRLSQLQWQMVVDTAQQMAAEKPESNERTLFMLSALYSMYLRISELAASERWVPAIAPVRLQKSTSILSSKNAINRPERRKSCPAENSGMIANNFNDLVRINGNLHPLIFWKPIYVRPVSKEVRVQIFVIKKPQRQRQPG